MTRRSRYNCVDVGVDGSPLIEPYLVGDLVYYTDWPNFVFKVLEIEVRPIILGQCQVRVAFHTTKMRADGVPPYKPSSVDTIAASPHYFWDGHLFWPCEDQPKRAKKVPDFPHKCQACGGPAYQGFNVRYICKANCDPYVKKK